jgi:hypothetical protein
MTPSRNSPARPSCGWTRRPASSSATRHTGEKCQQLIGCGVGWEAAYVVLSVLYRYASTISFG